MTTGKRPVIWKARATVIIVAMLFLLPIFISWFLVFFTDFGRETGGIQHGRLISPPVKLDNHNLEDPFSGEIHPLYEKWTLLTPVGNNCDEACQESLYKLRQIRLAMGKEMGRVQRATYYNSAGQRDINETALKQYPGHLVISHNETLNKKLNQWGEIPLNSIYLIDPAGFAFINYPEDTDPSGIIKDMKRLLRISKLD